jgi:serine/threonine-protein kinase
VHDGEFLPRFLREISICRRLRHPSIVQVLDSSHAPDLVFVVLELVIGTSLGNIVNGAPMPLERFFNLYAQLVAGVHYAHHHGVVHRDLKSGNIMVTDDDRIKVLDFGIARSPADHTITDARFIVGTPFYMSPEQLFGAPFDPRMDQYALGVVGYEMVTGRLPFDATNMTNLIQEINYAVPIRPRILNPDIPVGLEQMLMRMLEKQPDARFTDLDFVLAELQRCQRDMAGSPRTEAG